MIPHIFDSIISASLSPNVENDDVLRALQIFFTPWQWKLGANISATEHWFKEYFGVKSAVSFNSGRSALLALLTSLGVGKGDEVLLQAFTCVAVPNSVLWAGATPIYVDIDDSYNLDPKDIVRKITKKTKVIIVTHTFGIPASMDEIVAIARKHNILLIEDCAHALGGLYKEKRLGTMGDAAMFSFGRDKVISSVWGGMAIINPMCKVPHAHVALAQYQKNLSMPGLGWIAQQLFHPIAFSLILPTYNSGLGKVLLVLCQKLRLLSFPVVPSEKKTLQPKEFPKRYPNALAGLLLGQLPKLDRYNRNRKEIGTLYDRVFKNTKNVSFLRYPLLVANPNGLIQKAKQKGILLGNWYHNVIDPVGTDMGKAGYTRGSCSNAEEKAARVVNLPTRISQGQAQAIIDLV